MELKKFIFKCLKPDQKTFRGSVLRSLLFYNPIFSLVFTLVFSGFEHFAKSFLISYLIGGIVSGVIVVSLFAIRNLDVLLRRLRGKADRKPSRAWWFVLSLSVMPLGLYAAALIMPSLALALGLGSVHIDLESSKSSLVIGGLIGSVFFFYGIFSDTKKSLKLSESKLKELENQHLQAQLSALRAQMNPHLLFNALNTVASLVQSDPDKAEETIVKLSELYRGVLSSSQRMTHSLATEIKICEAYLSVEKARFGDRLRSHIEIDSEINSQKTEVPALSLQPLIENAVKHGISSKASGGEIKVRASNAEGMLKISIEDNGVGFGNSTAHKNSGTGTGLKNCKERMKIHYGEFGNFEIKDRIDGGTIALLTLPLIFLKGES